MRKATVYLSLALILVLVLAAGTIQAKEYDLNGDTVTIVTWANLVGAFEVGGEYEGRLEEAEEKFNISIEQVRSSFNGFEDFLMTRLLAGDSVNDMWHVQNRHYWKLVPQGAFYPVSDTVSDEYFAELPAFSRNLDKSASLKGKIYGFGTATSNGNCLRYIVWNKTLFEREGLPKLDELYEKGTWTWDKFREIANQATKDTDGDGTVDQFGVAAPNAVNWALANDGKVSGENENGKRVFTFDQEPAIEAMKFVYNLQAVDNVVGGSWDGSDFIAGKVAMQPMGMYLLGKIKENTEDEWGVVPYPIGPSAKDYNYPAEVWNTLVLPANAKDPEALVALERFLWPLGEEYEERIQNMLEGYAPDRDSFEVLATGRIDWEGEVFELDYVLGPTWGDGPFAQALSSAMSAEKSPKAAMEEVKSTLQATIDELFEQ